MDILARMAKEANVSWRPKNWKRKLPKIHGKLGGWEMETYREVAIARHAFEAGADAILKSLVQRSVIRTFGVRAAADSPQVKATLPNEPGVWAFIPDEDQVQHSTENR
jgi:hypothetical protein